MPPQMPPPLMLLLLIASASCLAHAKPSEVTVTTVHVIQSCHLDVGFSNTSASIINEYFEKHIPNAIATAASMRAKSGGSAGLRFMAQAYYISLYLDCPAGMGLVCPTAASQETLRTALKNGDIYYHAFPHNAELEMGNPEVVTEGIRQCHALDDSLGLPRKATLSQRDVPGLTRAAIPLLAAQGVTAVSVGVNGASAYPRVPKLFRWQDTLSGTEVYGMWHPKGYGSFSRDEAVTAEGLSHALVYDWKGDNQGPKSEESLLADLEAIQKEFPGAEVVPSTFDNFTQHLGAVRDALPVVSQEIGDSWIYGCPSDPLKGAKMAAMHRQWGAYVEGGGERTPGFLNATRLMLKNIEHTWGRDVKTNLKDNYNWGNAGFHAARVSGENASQYQLLEAAWREQREWGFDHPMQALKEHGPEALHAAIEKEFAELDASVPDLSGFERVADPSQVFQLSNGISIGFSNATGAVTTLRFKGSQDYAGEGNPLLLLNYTSYSQEDYQEFFTDYCSSPDPPSFFPFDFGKPNETVSEHRSWIGSLQAMYHKSDVFVLRMSVGSDRSAVSDYGAPETVYLTVDASKGEGLLKTRFDMFNKTATRLPESMFVSFNPASRATESFRMQKLSQWIPVANDTIVWGGSTHLHGVDAVSFGGGSLVITPYDAHVFNLGVPSGFPTPEFKAAQIASHGAASVLWNNLWGTNYVMWYPFNKDGAPVSGEENLMFRYDLQLL